MSRRYRYHRGQVMDAEWRMERDQAETVICRDCHAPIGSTCTNLHDGQPLTRLPAHSNRITDATGRPACPATAPADANAPRLPALPVLTSRRPRRRTP